MKQKNDITHKYKRVKIKLKPNSYDMLPNRLRDGSPIFDVKMAKLHPKYGIIFGISGDRHPSIWFIPERAVEKVYKKSKPLHKYVLKNERETRRIADACMRSLWESTRGSW